MIINVWQEEDFAEAYAQALKIGIEAKPRVEKMLEFAELLRRNNETLFS